VQPSIPLGENSSVLVTGGFGFLGGHILEQLLNGGVGRVHVVDDLSSNPVGIEVLLSELPKAANLSYDLMTVRRYLEESPEPFDVVIHLASVVGPAGVLQHGGRMVSSIVNDTYLLADYALEHDARLVDVSTSEVYGGGRDGLCREEDPKIVPAETSYRLEYAIAKLAAETALVNLHARSGLDVTIVRPFNIGGPRQSGEGGFVVPRFLAQAQLELPLTIFGTGQARRAFSHVKDLAEGVIRATRYGIAGTAYNLGNHKNVVTVDELANCVISVTGSTSRKEYTDPMKIYGADFVEANDKFPAAGRAIVDLGWTPRYDVEAVVKDAWEYMRAASAETFARLAGRKVIEQLVESRVGDVTGAKAGRESAGEGARSEKDPAEIA
jgi:nucleoside-diphosphate-sugar epimerase